MENKKTTPATQQPLTQQHYMAHHVHADQIYSPQNTQLPTHLNPSQASQLQPNGVMHQLLQSQYHSNMNARSPLLENRHDVYGNSQDYNRYYGANDNYSYPQSPPRTIERTEVHTDHNVNHELLQNMPKGYNAEVYQDYLKRNPPKDTNQIYQNHQTTNKPKPNAQQQYGSKPYLPYSSRIGNHSNTELLRRQYNDIQQMKLQQQMHYQNQAQMHQQQKFAERQLLLQQIHGVQPPPNLQNSIYSDNSYRDLDRYCSKNEFSSSTDLQKDVDRYAKNNEFQEIEKQNRQYQESQWQSNQGNDRETEIYRRPPEGDKSKNQSQPSDSNNSVSQKNNVGVISPMKSSESSSPSIKSPSSESRRSSSGNQALRSPIAQRIQSAPVTMSGILYKQGSDGLKVWRKRWFVLSEYCLFYYKSQDEEKLLGSVLLPSYRVSACTAEDKVLRKFAFKLEHTNMRTYVLAAPDQETMLKWVKTLTMAALMQNTSEHPQKQSERAVSKTEDGDEVSGPTYANAPPKPRRSNDGYNSPSPDIYDPNYDLLKKPASHYSQGTSHTRYPDTNYQTSPNQEPTYNRTPQSPQIQHQNKRQYDTHHLSLPLTNTVTDRLENNQPSTSTSTAYLSNQQSPYFDRTRNQQHIQENGQDIYDRQPKRNPFIQEPPPQETVPQLNDLPNMSNHEEQERAKSVVSNTYPEMRNPKSAADTSAFNRDVYGELNSRSIRAGSTISERLIERRTPDAYGRSTAMSNYNKSNVGDYEDVYAAYAAENEYGKSAFVKSPNQTRDAVISSHQKQDAPVHNLQEKTFSGPSVLRRKKMQASGIQAAIPRPHSADFLEYEAKHEMMNQINSRNNCDPPRQPQRPKSSLDINSFYDPSSDRYYSEESYAEKMRQSAQYLQQAGTRNIPIPLAKIKYASDLAEKQLNSAYSQISNNNYETEFSKAHRDNISYNSKFSSEVEGLNSNWTLKEKGLENHKEFMNRSGSVMSDGSNVSGYAKDVNRFDPTSEGFIRSASARLPSTQLEKEGDKKVQQREESMKRLLEWKQRMLQSPLTRKSTPATISLARSLNQSRQSLKSDQYKQKSFTNATYNSYSSDDEEESPGTELHITQEMQAGRSHRVNTVSPMIVPPSSPHVHSDTVDVPIQDQYTPDRINTSDKIYENITCTTTLSNEIVKEEEVNSSKANDESTSEEIDETQNLENTVYEIHESEAESETQIEYTDNDLDEVLLNSDCDENPANLNESMQSTQTVEEQCNSNLEIENLETKSECSAAQTAGENHYLPMSPRKSSSTELVPIKILPQDFSVFDNILPRNYEDNPYVEMNLGNEEEDMQTYEIVCVNNGNMEPVYMELSHVSRNEISKENISNGLSDTASNFVDPKNLTLKRASKGDKSNKEKSDASDADDEAPKDTLLEAPYSRFSISDNFRPASYYLNGGRVSLETPDGSDSDILPRRQFSFIPSCDDLSDEALSQYILDKLDQSDMVQDNSILKMLTSENQKMNTVKRKTTSLMIYGSRTSIHDTLSRGEKIRNNRASLTKDRNKLNESSGSLLNNSIIDKYNSSSNETDSLISYNADRGSSRLSLESDISSKFEILPSNVSSEVTSLNESEIGLDLNNPSGYTDPEIMFKRRPLSDESLFEMVSTEQPAVVESLDLDKYLDNLQPGTSGTSGNSHANSDINDSDSCNLYKNNVARAASLHPTHMRCSSTPVHQTHINRYPEKSALQFKNISEQRSGYTGSQSSCSSGGITRSPISYYCKSFDEEKLAKNLNSDVLSDKIKEFETEKINIKTRIETNASSTSTGFHSRESSTEQSAPYYYSDLSSQEHINLMATSHYLKNTNVHRKLNNQRRRVAHQKKNEISHIHNPIRSNQVRISDHPMELVARSVSVEFLSAADKDTEIDIKNIYQSTGGKISKIPESMNLSGLGGKKNSSHSYNESSPDNSSLSQRCSLNVSRSAQVSNASMSSHCSGNSSNTVYYDAEAEVSPYENVLCPGDKHWDEDSIWRDNLRRVSHRHARSMDDLDAVPSDPQLSYRIEDEAHNMNSIKRVKKMYPPKISRNVTYVNCDIQSEIIRLRSANSSHLESHHEEEKVDDNDVYVSLVENSESSVVQSLDEGVYEQLAIESSESSSSLQNNESTIQMTNKRRFEIDREKLRQWDLMSSGLMKSGTGRVRGVDGGVGMGDTLNSLEAGTDSAGNSASTTIAETKMEPGSNNNISSQQALSKKGFLGSNTSIGRSNRDSNIPVRAVSPRVRWVEEKSQIDQYGSQQLSTSQQNIHNVTANVEDNWASVRSPSRASQQLIRAVSPRVRRNESEDVASMLRDQHGDRMEPVPTAGELLGRTHEELVLLLIQLRRRHAATHRAMEQCCSQISSIEDCLSSLKAMEREENLQRLEHLKMQLMDLEHQYEKSKPLVQLVDNMVKLGSLYNRPGSTVERLERNQRLRQKILAEHAFEQQRWIESAAAGKPLETEAARSRVAELWALEQELADEAALLQGLKTDKDTIESLLSGVRGKLDTVRPMYAPAPSGLEAELARVHAMLAHNSKKLEQTVADNARLERELQQLRRTLQARRAASPHRAPVATNMLEDEVTRVQQLVLALQRQRQELSRAVRHLTQQSHALQNTQDSMPGKSRRPLSSWQETNLDTGHTIDHGHSDYDYDQSPVLSPGQYEQVQNHYDLRQNHYGSQNHYELSQGYDQGHYSQQGHYGQKINYEHQGQYEPSMETPLYVDTRAPGIDITSPINSEDMQHSTFANLSNVEKQEIKTVRIVKRESERRQRDRERSLQPMADWPTNNISANLEQFIEEELVQSLNNVNYNRAPSVQKTDFSKFEEYYSKPQDREPPNYLSLHQKNMELSPKFPSSPSLSNYDYSRDISSLSSSYHKSYDRSGYDRTISLSTQYLNSPTDSARTLTNDPLSKTSSVVSLTRSHMELSPIFKSEAAKQIITEMSHDTPKNGSIHRRQVPKEKRRHYTAPHHLSAKTLNEMPKNGYNQDKLGRSLDDTDMERALRPSAPDVVPAQPRAHAAIDQLLAAPRKICIPERYIPEKPPELSPEEQQKRQEKVESIKKMLTGTSADANKSPDGEEKKQREHLLQMNQILAKQVTEMSKIIAVKALEELPQDDQSYDLDDRSPDVELPIYQQRDNFFT